MPQGGGLGRIGEPCQRPYGPGAAHEKDEGREHGERRAQPDPERDESETRRGDEHRPPLTDPCDELASREVEEEGADAAQGDDRTGHRRRGSEVEGDQGDDGSGRALADGEEDAGQVDGAGERGDPKLLVAVGGLAHAEAVPIAPRTHSELIG